MNSPDLNLLRTFLAVYRSGSFTAAAGLLGLSQSTVTAQIRSLERELRRSLFERLPRGVAPTPFARDLASRVAAPLGALATRYLCEPELTSGALVPLHTPEDPPLNTGCLAQRPGHSSNLDVTRVRDVLLEAGRGW
ncbi:LysR family transcriptional regulator [Streptomyces sp. NPDC058459]|uniref:LysR family transcriptional regulator n=1 Tax=Streptomyces sp. NPDC058459 TaxID=3346508 RepID=UPI00364D1882